MLHNIVAAFVFGSVCVAALILALVLSVGGMIDDKLRE